MTSNVIVDCFV